MKNKIHALLEKKLACEYVEVIDESAAHAGHAGALEGGHFAVTLVSAACREKTSVERHRLVYDALAELGTRIHALRIKAYSPEEWVVK